MRTYTFSFLVALLFTGCAIDKRADGNTYILLPQMTTVDGYATGRSASVTTYIGTVNGKGYTATSFR